MFVLDIGCGESKLGDINVDTDKNVKPDIVADAQFLPLKKEIFDKALCFEVIEHVHSPFLLLKEIHRVLRPNSTLIVSTPNPYLWTRLFSEIILRKSETHPNHTSCFTRGELKNLAEKTGFHVISINYKNPPFYRRYWAKQTLLGTVSFLLDKFIFITIFRERHIIMVCKKESK